MMELSHSEQPATPSPTNFKQQLFRWASLHWIIFLATVMSLIGLMLFFNREYYDSLQNANVASEFNMDFKDQLDLEMYYYVVGARDYQNLPTEDVDHARSIVRKLERSTTGSTNRWRLQSMLNLLERLDEVMVLLSETKGYDERMIQLENNIYIITALIETYMHDYINDEIHVLAKIQSNIQQRMLWVMGVVGSVMIGLLLIMIHKTLTFTEKTISPIHQLLEKVSDVGEGRFNNDPILTQIAEFNALDRGVDQMSGQIAQLMHNIKEEQEALRGMEFELLQAQIKPHFLYNTLDSIIWLAESDQNQLVIAMVSSLSEFFRNSLSAGKDIISLDTEKKQVESYLQIQKIRYDDILNYEIDVPETLNEQRIPKLTLQPLVENSLYHGIKQKRQGGLIRIIGQRQADHVVITVEDNGVGVSAEKMVTLEQDIQEERRLDKVGLINVHQRLRLYFGDRSGISFESVEGKGFKVRIILPIATQDVSV